MTPREAFDKLVAEHRWSEDTLKVWWRAGCRCEYCNADLIASSDVYFRGAHIDHIVPGNGNHLDNLALACVSCNLLKRATHQNSGASGATDRGALIVAAKRIIQERRKAADDRLASAMPLLRALLAAPQDAPGP